MFEHETAWAQAEIERRSAPIQPRGLLYRFAAGMVAVTMAATACGADPDRAADVTTVDADGPAPSPAPSPAVTTTPEPTTTVPPLDATFAAIADRTTMTDEARRLLALSSPELVGLDALGETCTFGPEVSVLGCYRSGRIAVLDVTDPRLDGMVETTTAHELLHAAWAQFDDAERVRVTELLWTAFDRASTPELESRLDLYRQRDPASVDGELHSILGTEVGALGPELESHFRRWFTDRATVVALAQTVQATFGSLKAQVDDLDRRLADLRSRIATKETALERQRADLQAEMVALEALRRDGRIDEYNAAIEPHNTAITGYNAAVAEVGTMIDEFNGLVEQRNALAADYGELVAEIGTSAATMPAG